MSWYLDSVYELNKESPYTFYIPSLEVLEKLEVGDLVKLIFVPVKEEDDGFRGERMWVEISEINGKNYLGQLANEPHQLPLKLGDVITFENEHICATQHDDAHSSKWDFYFDTLVTVSDDVLEKEEFHFMLKDDPHEDGDSGWTILSGYEETDF